MAFSLLSTGITWLLEFGQAVVEAASSVYDFLNIEVGSSTFYNLLLGSFALFMSWTVVKWLVGL